MAAPRPGLTTRPSSAATQNKKIVLVTGGNAGIGYEIVKALSLKPTHQYQILMGCRDTSKGEAAAATMGAPINVNPIQLDITDDRSIELCYKTIEQMFGRLDILVNNAGTAGNDLKRDGHQPTPRDTWSHVFNVNAISTGVFTEKMIPLLQIATLPKIIFISSALGSIQSILDRGKVIPVPFYNASKAAVNLMAVHYAVAYPNIKVNSVCPGLRATGLASSTELNDETDPALGAVRAMKLIEEGPDGATGTYTNTEGVIPW